MTAPTLAVVVPVAWGRRSELIAAVRKLGEGYVFAGRDLKKVGADATLPVSVVDHDPLTAECFARLGPGAGLTPAELNAVASHPRAARVSLVAQGPALAARVLEFTAAVVRAGGLGVSVESGRKVLSAQNWLQLSAQPYSPRALYAAFVSLAPMPDGSCYYSTGMQAMNLPDAAAPADQSPEQAAIVLAEFLTHCFEHSSELGEGRMFRPKETQHFRMKLRDCHHFPPGHPQHNPHGLWHLR